VENFQNVGLNNNAADLCQILRIVAIEIAQDKTDDDDDDDDE